MYGISTMLFGQLDDPGNIQVSPKGTFIFSDQVGLVRRRTEHAVGILLGVNGDGTDSQVMAGPENTHGNLSPVGNQNFFEFFTH